MVKTKSFADEVDCHGKATHLYPMIRMYRGQFQPQFAVGLPLIGLILQRLLQVCNVTMDAKQASLDA